VCVRACVLRVCVTCISQINWSFISHTHTHTHSHPDKRGILGPFSLAGISCLLFSCFCLLATKATSVLMKV